MPDTPTLVTVPAVELIHTGSWPISTGTWDVTTADLHAAVDALQCPAVHRPILKLGHTDPRFDGEPAVGFISNMSVTPDGQGLVGDYTAMPSWLATQDASSGHSILASAYPNRSVEGHYEHRCTLGHTHPFVLTGVALLGVTPPGIGTLGSLQDLASMYGVAASADTSGPGVVCAQFGPHGGVSPRPTLPAPTASAAGPTPPERSTAVAFSDEQLTTMRQQLNLPDDADETAILAGLTDLQARLAAAPSPTPEPAPEPVRPATASLPEGMVAVDQDTLSTLQVAAARGVAAAERQDREDRERVVLAAIGDGRIPPAGRDGWLTRLSGPDGAEMATHLANMPKGLIPVAAKGHDTQPQHVNAGAATDVDDHSWVVPSTVIVKG